MHTEIGSDQLFQRGDGESRGAAEDEIKRHWGIGKFSN
jgi:hypothetical protein